MLIAIQLLHTIVWALLAGCILVMPIAALKRRFDWAAILTVIIVIECGVPALNHGRCPLTNLAARFTAERADNFDIFLPLWLARYNKSIFGTLFVINEAFVLWCLGSRSRLRSR
jgi:hypothetical protein